MGDIARQSPTSSIGELVEAESWTLEGALDEIETINNQVPERSFAFILGAGASVSSGIPSGATLAETWLRELYERTSSDGAGLGDWIKGGHSGIVGLSEDNAAECYPQIFEHRFRGDRESGYADLEAMMEGREPSLGYSLLAEVMKDTRHKVVVTTNFDNLVADALAIHAYRPPLIVGHETLTGFVRATQRRPLIAKIHRDLFYAPKSDVHGISTLEKGWQDALRKLFQNHTPIVIGYGGNDGSLMGFLKSLEAGAIAGRMFWCRRAGSAVNKLVADTVAQHRGVFVPISGFDEFMLRVTPRLVPGFDLSRIALRLETLGRRRADRYRSQVEAIRRRTEAPSMSPRAGDSDRRAVQRALLVTLKDEANWWTWEMRARSEGDPLKKADIYAAGLQRLPNSAELTSYFARQQEAVRNFPEAERLHQNAIRMRPDNVRVQLAYANFLAQHNTDLAQAKKAYLDAIAIDPSHIEALALYAHFLAYTMRDMGEADGIFARAIELDPKDPIVVRNYARFLIAEKEDVPRASLMYKRALTLNPGHAETIGNFAYFVEREEGKYDEAGALYRKALQIDRAIPQTLTNYALYLLNRRDDIEGAERHFVEALELLPNDSLLVGNYVSLLLNHRRDYEAAETLVRKACAHAPNIGNNFANLAAVLLCRRQYPSAREAARKAIALEIPKLSQVLAEALLYEALAAVALSASTAAALSRLKGLFERGFPRVHWNFDEILRAVFDTTPSKERELFYQLGAAILDKKATDRLGSFEEWARLRAIDSSKPLALQRRPARPRPRVRGSQR